MSGIEAIGLALALWPVLSTMNELYNSAKDGTAARWAMTIKVQERIFKECVLKLLQGDEDLSEKDRIGLINGDKQFVSLWEDEQFRVRLEDRLDEELCHLIRHEVLEISKLVMSLRKTLGDAKLGAQVPARRVLIPSFRDVKRVLKRDEVKANIDNLAFHNSALRKLLKTCSNTAYADARQTSARGSQRSTAVDERKKRIDTQFYDGFHEVLCKSFHCTCPGGHEANLSVTDTLVMFQPAGLSRAMSNLRLRGRSATMESDKTMYEDPGEEEDMMR